MIGFIINFIVQAHDYEARIEEIKTKLEKSIWSLFDHKSK